ncbi:MAG: hypothetical protein RQM90_13960 [Methanoculleus sp.]
MSPCRGSSSFPAPLQLLDGILDPVAGEALLRQDIDDLIDLRLAAGLPGEIPDRLLDRSDDIALRLRDARHEFVDIETPALCIVGHLSETGIHNAEDPVSILGIDGV